MGYRLNRLDEPVFIEVSKPLLTEFGIHYRLESCGAISIATIAFYLYFRTTGITPNIEKRLLCIFKFEEGDHIFIPCC